MRKLISTLFLSLLLLSLYNCSECNNENPRARVTNLSSNEVSVQIKTSGGNTENISNIETGKSSEFRSYSPGDVNFIITSKNKLEFEAETEVDFCTDYEIIIEENNSITIIPTNIE
ncbi:hypothetical protein [Tenacibaculum agarivorans]|uniref:hypothetical protein n=1 Tax=Tenacibaculum agarivorans TaxID=1908389 RepID=UPI000A5D322F|nr:hypothetical protein [Tenacibaculum agarivorans]